MAITVFKRYEKKYMLTMEQYEALKVFLADYMRYDKYCLNNKSYKLYNSYCQKHPLLSNPIIYSCHFTKQLLTPYEHLHKLI